LYGLAGSSGKGGNFIELMLRLAHEGRSLKVVTDQRLSPTYTFDLARKIIELISTEAYGLYHITNECDCSWYEFACTIFEMIHLSPDINPTLTADFGAKASRPFYSVLGNIALHDIGFVSLRPWRDALRDYLAAKGYL
jgi:dTDP-4-dehydrorhamnose reductase